MMVAYSVPAYLVHRQAVLVAAATTLAVAPFPTLAALRSSDRIWMQGQQYCCNKDNGIETSDHKWHKTAGLQHFGHHNSDKEKSAASQHSISYFTLCQLYTQPR